MPQVTDSTAAGAAVVGCNEPAWAATSVTFNSTFAQFTVVSNTEIKTTVPSGVTTGKVKVTTPSCTLTSNVNFRVTPTISSFSPTSGPVGTSVVINGENFAGATSVTFGEVKGTITSVSYTKLMKPLLFHMWTCHSRAGTESERAAVSCLKTASTYRSLSCLNLPN